MSAITEYTCDRCGEKFKTHRSGGKTPDFVPAVYVVPVPHFKLSDARGDNYDFCSAGCLSLWVDFNG